MLINILFRFNNTFKPLFNFYIFLNRKITYDNNYCFYVSNYFGKYSLNFNKHSNKDY